MKNFDILRWLDFNLTARPNAKRRISMVCGLKGSFAYFYSLKKSRWPARRDLNPRPPESESVALSSCATSGNSNNIIAHPANIFKGEIAKNAKIGARLDI